MKPLFICFTMDVERIKAESATAGPTTWEQSKIAIETMAEILNPLGYPITYFLIPYAIEPQLAWLTPLLHQKNEFGLHFHTESWKDNYISSETHLPLSLLDEQTQYIYLKEASELFTKLLGFAPLVFRPGFFSMNQTSFSILHKLGFLGGSCSLPGRYNPKYGALWRSARRDIHAPLQIPQHLSQDSFIEVPVVSKTNIFGIITKKGDIRIENHRSKNEIMQTLRQTIDWQSRNKAKFNHLCFLTHNFYNFAHQELAGIPSKNEELNLILTCIDEISQEKELQIKGLTISDCCKYYLKYKNSNLEKE